MKSNFLNRKNYILEKLEAEGQIDTAKLAEELNVTKETLRKDLTSLEEKRLLIRTHGGALRADSSSPAIAQTAYRQMLHREEKEKLCRAAASQIKDGDTIYIDGSTTCFSILKFIDPSIRITVITNSIQLIVESEEYISDKILVFLVGGIYVKAFHSCFGDMAIKMSSSFHPNKAFFSFMSLDDEGNLYDADMYGVDLKKHFTANTESVYFLLDHSKIGKRGGISLISVDAADVIITDDRITEQQRMILECFRKKLLIV